MIPQVRAPNAPIYDRAIRLQRTLIPELTQLQELFSPEWKDEFSEVVRFWLMNFKESLLLRTVSYEFVLNTFLIHLENLLATSAPLDAEAMLGSDGRVYGKRFLCLHRARTEAPYNDRSPLEPEDPKPFMASAHTPMRELVAFLRRHRPIPPTPLDNEYDTLLPHQKDFEETHPQVQKAVLNDYLRRRRQAGRGAFVRELVDGIAKPKFEELRRDMAQNHAERHEELNHVVGQFRQEAEKVREQIRETEVGITVATQEINRLRNEQQYVGAQIQEADRENRQLAISNKETERAIRDKQKRWLGELAQLVGTVLLSWGASYVFKMVVRAVPGGVVAGPVIRF